MTKIEYVGSDGSHWTLTGGGPGVEIYTAPLGTTLPDTATPVGDSPSWNPIGWISGAEDVPESRLAKPTDFPHSFDLTASGVLVSYTPTECLSCGKMMQAGDRVVDRAMGAYFIHATCANEGSR